jgi:signal transduction histidine kinase
MTLRTRLILAIGGVALLMVVPALYAAHQLSRLREIAADVSGTHGAAQLGMGRFQANLADTDRLARGYVAIGDPDVAARRDAAMMSARINLARLERAGYADVARQAGAQLDQIQSRLAGVDELVAADRLEEATVAFENVKPLFAEADLLVEQIALEIDRRSEADLAAAARISAAALTTTLLALIACLFIAVLLGTWATHTLLRPIQRLRRSMAAVAAGEFVVPEGLPYERHDELGDLARSFRGMTQQLADLDRMKADFMSIATHELKTPINVVGGYAELIQEGVYGAVTEQQAEALVSIQEQARTLTQLVNQLLDISRLEAGGLRLEIAEMRVADLFEEVRRTFDVLAHKQSVDLHVELTETAPEAIPADRDRLRDQVLGNLLSNALKFTPPGGAIRVRGWGEDDRLCIEVSDEGAGMPPDLLPHVFDKYFQISGQARSQGAGLGLTIAHDVIEEHGGTITVESEEGAGTTFRIVLPATGRESTPAAATAGADRRSA